jgi:predicted Zn-ribbon and HTH transcriptional regulator
MKAWNDAWLLLVEHRCQRCGYEFKADWLRAMVRRELDEADNLPF